MTPWSATRFAAMCLVFFGVPVVLICLASNQVWREIEQQRLDRLFARFDHAFGEIVPHADTVRFMNTFFRELTVRVPHSDNPRAKLQRLLAHAKRRFPGMFTMTFVDWRGNVDGELSDGQPPRTVLKRLAAFFRDWTDNKKPSRQDEVLFRGFYGPMVDIAKINPDRFESVNYKLDRAYAFTHSFANLGLLIVHLNHTPDFERRGMVDRVAAFNRRSKSLAIALFDAEEPIASVSQRLNLPGVDFGQIYPRLDSTTSGSYCHEGRWFAARMALPTVLVIATAMGPSNRDVERERLAVVAVLLLSFTVLTIMSWLIATGRWTIYISIRAKLVLLFLYAAFLPLAFMSTTAYNYLRERRVTLERQTSLDVEQGLKLFDAKFPQLIGHHQRTLRDTLGRPYDSRRPLLEAASDRVSRLCRLLKTRHATIYDPKGDVRWSLKAPGPKARVNDKMMRQVAVNTIRTMNNDDADPTAVTQHPVSQFYGAVAGLDLDVLYSQLTRNLGRITEFRLPGDATFQFLFPILGPDGRAEYLLVLGWRRTDLARIYIKRCLLAAGRRIPHTEMCAVDQFSRQYDFPPNYRYSGWIEPLLMRLRDNAPAVRATLRRDGRSWLLTGMRGQELPDHSLVAVTGDHEIRAEIGVLRWQFGFGAVLLVLVSATVGSLLAQSFLEPVRHLTLGISALHDRRFSDRVPVLDRDELGDLAATFNTMMEGLEDLEVARIVQESLFPTEPLTFGTGAIYGSCLPASEVGGDYYDYFMADNSNLVILIGDVSGHGVGAAMVMAMAKALVAHLTAEGTDPSRILNELNRLFLTLLKRKKMMSCFFAFLDLRTLALHSSNAGHNFPYLLRKGHIESLSTAGFPLGTRAKAAYPTTTVALQPGDTILFYTDGLVEAIARHGGQIGYEALESALPAMIGATPGATERSIRTWHRDLAAAGPQADDISVVILQLHAAPTPAA